MRGVTDMRILICVYTRIDKGGRHSQANEDTIDTATMNAINNVEKKYV